MTQTIAIAGTGQMGRSTLRILSRRLPDARFRLIDISQDSLEQAGRIAPNRTDLICCDIASDEISLGNAAVVINFAGPFYLGSDRLAKAAIEAGVPYVDVCDDAEGTQTILDLDAEARTKGISIITGGGLSPGISNWLACEMIETDPSIDGIQIVWITREKDPGGLAVLRHMLHMTVTPCPTWRDGKLNHTKGFVPETAQEFDVPAPFDHVEAYDTAHPEPVTLGKAFPQLKLVECKGSLWPNWANAAFSTLGRVGFGYSDITVEVGGRAVSPVEVLWKLLWARHERSGRGDRISNTQVNVIGLARERPVIMSSITDDADMSRGTGLGMACAALALLEGKGTPGANGVEGLPHKRGLELFRELAAVEGAFPRGIEKRTF